MAHERGCEAELAAVIDSLLDKGQLPNIGDMRAWFLPDAASLPTVLVQLAPLSSYDILTNATDCAGAA
jgi:hypothetical protein